MTLADKYYSDARIKRLFTDSPFITALGVDIDSIAPGKVCTSLSLADRHMQHNGYAHAGVVASLADHSAGAAGATKAPADHNVLTVEFKLNLLRPAIGSKLECVARVLKAGKTLSVVESEIRAAGDERLIAKATVTLALIAPSGSETGNP